MQSTHTDVAIIAGHEAIRWFSRNNNNDPMTPSGMKTPNHHAWPSFGIRATLNKSIEANSNIKLAIGYRIPNSKSFEFAFLTAILREQLLILVLCDRQIIAVQFSGGVA